MGIVRERDIRKAKRALNDYLKPGETITDAISRLNEKISMAEIDVEEAEEQLSEAEGKLSDLRDAHDDIIGLRSMIGEDSIPAKRKKRPEKKTLLVFGGGCS